ncbi:MAG: hypothetical protein V4558_13590 [Gemmatimonadota bacterium]
MHRTLHTFLVGGVVGVVVGAGNSIVGRRCFGSTVARAGSVLQYEFHLRPSLWGGLMGGLLHSLLDGIMHADIRPFRPLTQANPLYGAVALPALHLACILCGVIGAAWLAQARYWRAGVT